MKLKRILVSLLVSVMLPANVAVAEPSIGTFGSDALAQASSLVAKPSLDRFTGRRVKVEVSAYTTRAAETDSTPCIAANGEDICLPSNRNTVAINGLAFGTLVMIPSIGGDTVYEVRDRMNSRYGEGNMDVLADSVSEARQIGRRTREVIILD